MKHLFTLIVITFMVIGARAQGVAVPLNTDTYQIMDRLEIRNGNRSPMFHSSLKSYLRGDVLRYALQTDTANLQNLSDLDRADLRYLYRDNNEWLSDMDDPTTLTGERKYIDQKTYVDSSHTFYSVQHVLSEAAKDNPKYERSSPLFKYFYRTPANLFEYNSKYLYVRANPILNVQLMKDSGTDQLLFTNQRGAEIRGAIDSRVYFYTNLVESQSQYQQYVVDRVNDERAFPGGGFYKPYTGVLKVKNGYDYNVSQGYIATSLTRHIGVQFGHGKNFLGNGIRSVILSDFSNNYLYLKFNTRLWKFHYQNLFCELTSEPFNLGSDRLLPKKYLAAHYLSFRPTPNLTFGVYEATVFNRKDKRFELNYLNPVIFYRTVEGLLGSSDNALLGADIKWNFLKRFSFYSQFILDEFSFGNIKAQNGWWANKYGFQAGLKYINVAGIDHLDAQVEFNFVRPFTFTHYDSNSVGSYTHYHQPLAHPLKAGFKEYILNLRYQPIHKLSANLRLMAMKSGEDSLSTNFGYNLNISNQVRAREYNNKVAQGATYNTLLVAFDLSYQIRHNIYIDAHYFYRRKDSVVPSRDALNQYFGAGIRINIAAQKLEF